MSNPLYAKKPGESTSEHMTRLRKEFPTKFGRQKGVKNKPKPKSKQKSPRFTSDDIAQAERRGMEKAKSQISNEQIPVPPPANSPQEIKTDSIQSNKNSGPLPIHSDHAIFGAESVPPPKINSIGETASQSTGPQNQFASPQSTPTEQTAEQKASGAKYGTLVWGIIVKMFTGIFGPGFQPVVIKDSAGEIIYDEGAEGAKVWTNYLASIGVAVFSPLVELWIFMGSYVALRFGLIVQKFKRKKSGEQDLESPKPSPETGATTQKAEPMPKKTTPPPSQAPAPEPPIKFAPGEIQIDEEHFGGN